MGDSTFKFRMKIQRTVVLFSHPPNAELTESKTKIKTEEDQTISLPLADALPWELGT